MTPTPSVLPQNAFLRWTRKLADATEWLAAVILGLIIAVNLTAVLARYVFSSPVGWSEEAMRYGIVWAVYLAAGATFRRGEQMAIDLFRHPPMWIPYASVVVGYLLIAIQVIAVYFDPPNPDDGEDME